MEISSDLKLDFCLSPSFISPFKTMFGDKKLHLGIHLDRSPMAVTCQSAKSFCSFYFSSVKNVSDMWSCTYTFFNYTLAWTNFISIILHLNHLQVVNRAVSQAALALPLLHSSFSFLSHCPQYFVVPPSCLPTCKILWLQRWSQVCGTRPALVGDSGLRCPAFGLHSKSAAPTRLAPVPSGVSDHAGLWLEIWKAASSDPILNLELFGKWIENKKG